MAKIWDIPFANAGDKQTIPVPAQPDGTVSTTQGWTPDYELPNTNPSYKPVGREEMNGALFEITESIQQLQLQGAAEWSTLLSPYPNGAEVIHSGERWRSLINGNTEEPGTGSNWIIVANGISQAQADLLYAKLAGLSTQTFSVGTATAAPHAVRYDQAFGIGQSWQTVTGSRVSGTTYTNSTGKTIVANVLSGSGATATTGIVNGITIYNSLITGGGQSTATLIIPAGATYSITSPLISSWHELR